MFDLFKKLKTYLIKNTEVDTDINYYLDSHDKIHPYSEALRITLFFGIAGAVWVLFSDEMLSRIVSDIDAHKKIAMYKGWAYVIITMLSIYSLILKRLLLFENALKKIYNDYEELNYANEELIALEEELRHQNNELEKHRNALNSLAYYDSLTGLPNRLLFEKNVSELINKGNVLCEKFALIYMDIDNFKNINDTLGHASGDVLIKYIANILKYQVKDPDMVARINGDEFAIVFLNIDDKKDVVKKIQNLLKYLRRPWILHKQEFFTSYSVGIAMYPENGDKLAMLLKNAHMAMYSVKKVLKDNFSFFSNEIQEKSLKQIRMVNELRRAVDNEEFELFYQPIIHLNSGKLIGVEALVRWFHPLRGMISPIEFIPLAEETGIIYDIGKWVFKTALLQIKDWEEKGLPKIRMSINVSGKRVTHKDFSYEVRDLVSEVNVDCDKIQIEVTETAVMEDMDASINALKEIRNMGIKIALDDFGAGYSSLTYLRKLPIDTVKLDRDFINEIVNKKQNNVIVESVIKLTHDLSLDLVAEGIETSEQLEFLKLNKCDYGQGYLFSKPVPKEEIEKLFLTNRIYD